MGGLHGGEVDVGEEAAAVARKQPPGPRAGEAGARAVEEAAVQPQHQAARDRRRKRRRARHLRLPPLQVLQKMASHVVRYHAGSTGPFCRHCLGLESLFTREEPERTQRQDSFKASATKMSIPTGNQRFTRLFCT